MDMVKKGKTHLSQVTPLIRPPLERVKVSSRRSFGKLNFVILNYVSKIVSFCGGNVKCNGGYVMVLLWLYDCFTGVESACARQWRAVYWSGGRV